ncbi:IS1595 family transposase ISCco4 (plasmid) [Apilactobacillus kunkeei]|nr:IS1595 family transposase ISCco4 [Apilactobacillus kunkeei]CAI2699862.1 IS1595 family transposase ISCco4 [Apilactobacillus kunkeei]
MNKLRSPLFYVGDKYKLMPQLNKLFPKQINTFYDVFVGGGSASLNTEANYYQFNDIDKNIMRLHKYLLENTKNENFDDFINDMYKCIDSYGLTHSENKIDDRIKEFKKLYKKTYFAKLNKEPYLKLREDYNSDQSQTKLLYLLLVYGFNHMTRFNKSGLFNLPVGNVDWNKNVTNALKQYGLFASKNLPKLCNDDFEKFIKSRDFKAGDFVYIDPPYLITSSEYNKGWGIEEEKRLYKTMDWLSRKNVSWGVSNIVSHKGNINDVLIEWMKKYSVHEVTSNYISRFDNTVKNSQEVYITNDQKSS